MRATHPGFSHREGNSRFDGLGNATGPSLVGGFGHGNSNSIGSPIKTDGGGTMLGWTADSLKKEKSENNNLTENMVTSAPIVSDSARKQRMAEISKFISEATEKGALNGLTEPDCIARLTRAILEVGRYTKTVRRVVDIMGREEENRRREEEARRKEKATRNKEKDSEKKSKAEKGLEGKKGGRDKDRRAVNAGYATIGKGAATTATTTTTTTTTRTEIKGAATTTSALNATTSGNTSNIAAATALKQKHASLLLVHKTCLTDLLSSLADLHYRRSQRHYSSKSYPQSIGDANTAIFTCPSHPLVSQFLLLKGMGLCALSQFADASETFIMGLKVEPRDPQLKRWFDGSVKLMNQARHYHHRQVGDAVQKSATKPVHDSSRSHDPSHLFDLGSLPIKKFDSIVPQKPVNPAVGFNDKRCANIIRKANGYVKINDLLQDEINFWAGYGLYLAREELKTELLTVLFEFKPVLVHVFDNYCQYNVDIEEVSGVRC